MIEFNPMLGPERTAVRFSAGLGGGIGCVTEFGQTSMDE